MRKITLLPFVMLVLAACGVTTPSSSSVASSTPASSTTTSTVASSSEVTTSATTSTVSSEEVGPTITSIQAARVLPNDSEVTVQGVVTRVIRQKSFFIQQGDFGINIFGYEGTEEVAVGDFIQVYGFIANYNGLMEITGPTGTGLPEVQFLDDPAPTITPVSINEEGWVNDNLAPNFDGRLVEIKKLSLAGAWTPLLVDNTYPSSGGVNVTMNLGAKTLTARFDRYINVTEREALNTFFGGLASGAKIDYTGVLGDFNGVQLAVASAADFAVNTDAPVLPTSISVTASVDPVEVVENLTLQLSATVLPADADDKSVTWASSDDTIATIDSAGLVTGIAPGTVTITATSVADNLVSGTLSVTVTPAPLSLEGVLINVGDSTLKIGATLDLDATLLPLGYVGQGLTFSSSDDAVATVTSEGIVEARAVGTATITAAATEDNTKTDDVLITVEDVTTIAAAKATAVNTVVTVNGVITRIIASNELFIQVGSEAIQVAGAQTAGFASGDFVQVTGPTQNSAEPRRIGAFSGGNVATMFKISFLAAPAITPLEITEATYNTTDTPLTNQWRLVKIDGLFPPQPWVNVGTSSTNRAFTLGAVAVDVRISGFLLEAERNSLNALFTDFWKNDTVNYEGILNAYSGALQVYPSGGSDFTLVEADPVLVSSITVAGAEGATSLASNGQLQLTATVLPANADVLDVTWSSSNDAVATVDQTGLVSGVAAGNVTITAAANEPGSAVIGTLDLTVSDPLVLTGISLSADPSTIGVGSTTQVVVTPTPAAWVGTYTYVSDTPAVATVDANGLVTGVSAGSAIITATSVETPAVSNTLTITVENVSYATDLIISEVYEGSSNNKYLEIFNGTGSTVDLSTYTVGLYGNGNSTTTPVSFPAGSTLAHGETFVFYNSSISVALFPELANIPDSRKLSSSVTFFNGDDAIGLHKDGVLIDVFGTIGTDPGSNWALPSGGTTTDHSVVRNPNIKSPCVSATNTWDDTQWTATAINSDIGGGGTLGTHTMNY